MLGIEDEDLEESVRQRIMEGIPHLLGEEPRPLSDRCQGIIPFIGKLFSIEFEGELGQKVKYLDPQQLKEMSFMAFRDLFAGMVEERPLILTLEDLHWADNTSIDLISYLMDATSEAPFIVMCIYRPEPGRRCMRIGEMARGKCSDRYTEFQIGKLSLEEEEELTNSLLEMEQAPSQVLETVHWKADGNPFYIEEVLRALKDNGAIQKTNGRWKIAGDLDSVEIPDTVQGMIMAASIGWTIP
jgi:adenylate cyclase